MPRILAVPMMMKKAAPQGLDDSIASLNVSASNESTADNRLSATEIEGSFTVQMLMHADNDATVNSDTTMDSSIRSENSLKTRTHPINAAVALESVQLSPASSLRLQSPNGEHPRSSSPGLKAQTRPKKCFSIAVIVGTTLQCCPRTTNASCTDF